MTRGDISIIACRNGISSANTIKNHLQEIILHRDQLLNSREHLTSYDERQLDFINTVKKHGTQLIIPNSKSIKDFADGEISINLEESVRGTDAYIIQNTLNPENPKATSHNIMELIFMTETVRRSSARNVTLVLPYLSYSKQERRQGRQPISAKVMIDLFHEVGADKIITMDLHASAIEGFTKAREMSIENLFASNIILDYLINDKKFKGEFLAPDAGAGKMVAHYSKVAKLELALGYKFKKPDSHHEPEEQRILGDVSGKDIAIIDDQLATGTTLLNTINSLVKLKANKIYLATTHGMFLKNAEEKFRHLKNAGILEEIIITTTIPHSKEFYQKNTYITQLDALKMFAEAVYENHVDGSISALYETNLRNSLFGENHKIPD